jgi:phospholipase C
MLERWERAFIERFFRRHGERHPAERPDGNLPPGTDTLPQIGHIVVLMMENHSYDNYLGMLDSRGEGYPRDASGNPSSSNPAKDGSSVPAFRFSTTKQTEGVPSQTWNASHIQFDDGACDGFVRSIETTMPGADAKVAMGYWTEQDLPFYYGLARTFPLCDHWFGSCLGPTIPNRRFLIAGTAHGLIDDLPFGMFDYPEAGTIFDQLARYGISWVNYHHASTIRTILKRLLGRSGLRWSRRLALAVSKAFPVLQRAVLGNLEFTADYYPLGLLGSLAHLRSIDRFWTDAAEGTLPAVSIVDPDFPNCAEENPQDILCGEAFAAKVINAVMHGNGWERTLLIWLYDEHGGYFDHVEPPVAPAPDDVPAESLLSSGGLLARMVRLTPWAKQVENIDAGPRTYDRYGFRVPAVIVSPYARRDYVCGSTFDHTSILKLIERKWNLPALTRRDAAALDPLEALDLDNPPAFQKPPPLPVPAMLHKG